MSGDEIIVSIVAALLGIGGWLMWAVRLAGLPTSVRRRPHRAVFITALASAMILVTIVLNQAASPDVRDDQIYFGMYFVLGLAWLRAAEWGFAFAGVSVRDDAIERGNAAALAASAGALIGVAACYAGGNVGSGPGWWVVVFSASLSTGALALCWLAIDAAAHVNDAVTIERDLASGLRFGGLLIGLGLVLGRAVAGDWQSAAATITDFVAVAWVIVPAVVVAVVAERMLQPTLANPQPSRTIAGLIPAATYIAGALAYLTWLGLP